MSIYRDPALCGPYFTVFRVFLDVNLKKNIATRCQIVSTHSRGSYQDRGHGPEKTLIQQNATETKVFPPAEKDGPTLNVVLTNSSQCAFNKTCQKNENVVSVQLEMRHHFDGQTNQNALKGLFNIYNIYLYLCMLCFFMILDFL